MNRAGAGLRVGGGVPGAGAGLRVEPLELPLDNFNEPVVSEPQMEEVDDTTGGVGAARDEPLESALESE